MVKKYKRSYIRILSIIFLSTFIIAASGFLFQGCSNAAETVSGNAEAAADSQGVDFSLPDLEGNNTSIKDYRGNVVVLNFWATWCPPCRAEIPDFIDVHESYKDKNVVFFGISADDLDSLKNFTSEFGMTYPTLYDADGRVHGMFKINAIPHTFILDKEGNIVFNQLGMMSKQQLIDAVEGAIK